MALFGGMTVKLRHRVEIDAGVNTHLSDDGSVQRRTWATTMSVAGLAKYTVPHGDGQTTTAAEADVDLVANPRPAADRRAPVLHD